MLYCQRYTTIPMPKIYAYDSSRANALRSPWMLIERLDAQHYAHAEILMSSAQKAVVGETVADWLYQLRSLHFDRIGNLFFKDGQFNIRSYIDDSILDGWDRPIVSPCGPLPSTAAYYRIILEQVLRSNIEDAQTNVVSMERVQQASDMLQYIPHLFPENDLSTTPAILQHIDISENNVLVNDGGLAVALIDWERAHIMPSKASELDVPYIVHVSGEATKGSKNEDTDVQHGFYKRMEQLEPGFRCSMTSEQAMKEKKLHMAYQNRTGGFTLSEIRANFDVLPREDLVPLEVSTRVVRKERLPDRVLVQASPRTDGDKDEKEKAESTSAMPVDFETRNDISRCKTHHKLSSAFRNCDEEDSRGCDVARDV